MSFFKKLLGQKGEPEPAKPSHAAAPRTASPVAPPTPPPAPPEIVSQPAQRIYRSGDTILDRYEVVGDPLMGGMGIVYICVDQQQDLPVALKTFKPEYLPDRATRDRFLREGATWMNLGAHPHIARCYEVIRDTTGLEVFLALELIAKGQEREDASLRSWLPLRHGSGQALGHSLPPETALLFALQIARGMQHAVARIPGFVHRDLKPENVLVGADHLPDTTFNRLRVTDFGLASVMQEAGAKRPDTSGRAQEASAMRHTQLTHGAVGTPLYMAPEQWTGDTVGVYTDVYALGCILYEMFTGYTAADGDNLDDLARAHCTGDLRPFPDSIPAPVRYILQRCLALNPGDRYTDWESLEFALASAYAAIAERPAPSPADATMLSREERRQVGWSYNAIGCAYLDISKAEVAVSYYEQALAIAREIGDRYGEGNILINLGEAYRNLGDARLAIRYCEQALLIVRETGDRRGESMTLNNLGLAYVRLGDVQRAIGYYEQGLTISHKIGDRHGEGGFLGNLGNAYADLGDTRRALGYFEQSLAILRDIGDLRGVGTVLGSLGRIYRQLGVPHRAIEYYEQCLKIAREIGDRHREGVASGNLGMMYADLSDFQRAIKYHEQHLEIAQEIGDQRGKGNALGGLGEAYLNLGDMQRAMGYFEQHLEIASDIGDRHGEGTVLGNLGVVYANLGDIQRAIMYYEKALVIRREIGDRRGEGIDLGNMGIAYKDLSDMQRAIDCYKQALTIAREIGYRRGEGNELSNLGLAYADLGDIHSAIDHYDQALAITREVGDINSVATVSFNMACLYVQHGKTTQALVLAQEAAHIWTQTANPNAQRAQQLVVQLQNNKAMNNEPSLDVKQQALEAFVRADSPVAMQRVVAQFPFMINPGAILAVERSIAEVQPEYQAAFQQRLAWLRQIAVGRK